MLCEGCGAEDHFVRFCSEKTKKLVFHVANLVSNGADPKDVETLLHDLQFSPDDPDSEETPDQEGESSEANQAENFYLGLADAATAHGILQTKSIDHHAQNRIEAGFKGIIMDNGAEVTVGGMPQHKACCKHTNTKINMRPSSQVFKFGDCIRKSLGIASIRMPLKDEAQFLEYDSHVIDLNAPLLFGLGSFKKYGFYVNQCTDQFMHNKEGWSVPLTLNVML
eukprot:Plantae.Rhodophyta-Hildenbrandia_rubra.ctg37776.p1 GENE.Plantae.Rhodophyta-Hildenbrandia_rubra.ctg37776~~Plantae.Rhodophyta-Hildenbrandia_rubra.ctg37776.p1  ORF type:complete len:223 (-),score=24.76 Plantae.Rhodophyta-Hildenbrandia_rubra.ctg37776:95-763(-)